MAKKKIIGYILLGGRGEVGRLMPEVSENAGGVWLGGSNRATLFRTVSGTKKAVALSRAFAKKNNYGWNEWLDRLYPMPVVRASR